MTLLIFGLVLPGFAAQAADEPIKILLVPGHDEKSPGAIYGNLREVDMNVALAWKIYELLQADERFEVHITQDEEGYTSEFYEHFTKNKKIIDTFTSSSKRNMTNALSGGTFVEKPNTPHGLASEDAAFKLYGVNKWVNRNDIDAVIHIHFNDHKRKNKWAMGQRRGFAIYVPDDQFVNSTDSSALAHSVFTELKKKYPVSDYYKEMAGVVPDQKLIALGANKTLVSTARSILVEYGYIYHFGNLATRHKAYVDMSRLTVSGIINYFFPEIESSSAEEFQGFTNFSISR